MNVISMLLVIAAAAALIGSFFRDDDLTLVFVSIGCCLAAFLFLFLGLLRSRPTRKPVLTGEAAQVPVPTTAPSATPAPAVAGPVVLPRVVEEPAAPVVEREVEGDQPWRREPVALDPDPDPDDTARVDLGARTRAPQPSAQGPVVVGPEPEEDEELFDDDDDEALAEAPAPRKAPLAVPPPAPVTPRRAPARSGATRAGATRATATSAAGAAKSTAGAARTTKAVPAPAPTGLPSDRDIARVEQVLRGVPGVGPTRRRDLLAHFGTYRKLKNASTLRLMEVPGITPTLADRVRTALDEA